MSSEATADMKEAKAEETAPEVQAGATKEGEETTEPKSSDAAAPPPAGDAAAKVENESGDASKNEATEEPTEDVSLTFPQKVSRCS